LDIEIVLSSHTCVGDHVVVIRADVVVTPCLSVTGSVSRADISLELWMEVLMVKRSCGTRTNETEEERCGLHGKLLKKRDENKIWKERIRRKVSKRDEKIVFYERKKKRDCRTCRGF
jgi:hypothetical protein